VAGAASVPSARRRDQGRWRLQSARPRPGTSCRPIVGSLGVDPVVIVLAIASGAMFALHVNSTFFWMFSTLLDLSTKGS